MKLESMCAKNNMEIYKRLGLTIREARLNKRMTMKELAAKVGITESAVHHYENGVRKMSFDTFASICKALDLNPSEVTKRILK